MAEIFVDFTPVQRDIQRVLSKAASEAQAQRAIMWGLNQVGAKALTKARRALVAQTSVPYSRVMGHVVGKPAHPNHLAYRIEARDTAIPLKQFLNGTVRAGQKSVPVLVWGEKRVIKGHAFMIGPGSGKARYRRGKIQTKETTGSGHELFPVKRVASGHGEGSLKALWGPIVPKELLRDSKPTKNYLETVVPVEFVPVLEQKLDAIMAGAGGKKP